MLKRNRRHMFIHKIKIKKKRSGRDEVVKSKSRERQIEGQSEELEAWMVSGIKGREGKTKI